LGVAATTTICPIKRLAQFSETNKDNIIVTMGVVGRERVGTAFPHIFMFCFEVGYFLDAFPPLFC